MNKWNKWVGVTAVLGLLVTGAGSAFAASSSSSTNSPVAGTVAHNTWSHGFHHSHGMFYGDMSGLSLLLKISNTTLHQDLVSGMSLAEIAQKENVPLQSVVNLIVSDRTAALSQAVKNGRMTQTEANQILAKLPAAATTMVNAKGFVTHGPNMSTMNKMRHGFFGQAQGSGALLTLLHIDSQTLRQDLMSGMSLSDIATKENVPVENVISLLLKNATAAITQAENNGQLSQTKANQILGLLPNRIKNMVDAKGMMHRPVMNNQDQTTNVTATTPPVGAN